jgi:hypothetical protein
MNSEHLIGKYFAVIVQTKPFIKGEVKVHIRDDVYLCRIVDREYLLLLELKPTTDVMLYCKFYTNEKAMEADLKGYNVSNNL